MTALTSSLFNSAITSSAISATFELGLFDLLSDSLDGISCAEFCKGNDLDISAFASLAHALQSFDIIKIEDDLLKKGVYFDEINKNKGYFHWMIKGYADFLADPKYLLQTQHRTGSFFKRDGASIARAGKDYGAYFVDQHVFTLLESIPIKKMADLGCGSANRILEVIKRKGCEAVGVEIDSGGVTVAQRAVLNEGYDKQVQIIQGDVSDLTYRAEFKDVDLISSFFMGHDLWPKERCIEIFRNFLKVFPNVEHFLFCDTFRSNLPPSPSIPPFTLGFEVFHAMMGQYIPSLDEWRQLFSEAGWNLNKEVETGIAFTYIFLLTPIR